MNEKENKNWHEEEQHKMVEKDSDEWKLAEKYKKEHPSYSDLKILIKEVWRDKNNTLCVRYISSFGRNLDWFHYIINNNNELVWW